MKTDNFLSSTLSKVIMYILFIIAVLFLILVVVRMFHLNTVDKTNDVVAKIHSTKLTLDDVMGKSLPPDPGALADQTIQGIDANQNGIRDDVELAIFKEYPNSAKTRAVLLQYALALQMEVTQPIVNTQTATEVITELSRADTCVADTLGPRKTPESSRSYAEVEKINTFIKFVEEKQLNTDSRKEAEKSFYKYLRSYGESTNEVCDIDYSKLLN